MAISQSNDFKQLISELQIDYTSAEFHGFLSGLIAGGIQDESWKTLTYQFTNDGYAFSQAPLAKLTKFYQQLSESFDETNTLFSLWLNEEDGFAMADGIAEWTGHFLLGLGLAQPTLQQETNEVGEAIDDLDEIAKLGYSEEDKNDELLDAGEEIIEYLRVVTLFLHSHFATPKMAEKPKVH
ncbi:UPF0149 family protein [Glaesserella parasuis]|uniref:UPF0149 family protein n=1 Tax=Glaesserella parasuis TaxID=738 RepID=UPI0009501857|nr:UPF0149 family protein [Glaesserella parasuis]MDG6345667.1 UPF0149 family protein [Glaesserella parasuis]MDG6770911.1 UPF0149 family protein [Glaesserella parasuis]MDO9873201.1 UPF0149 family protein [Glaesserella parasuis]MDO9913002.1 UPF0149 family protein [Glaesserella parasuis]MDP0350176.1 UPF0149 family protein [Glaesserella parasuis]